MRESNDFNSLEIELLKKHKQNYRFISESLTLLAMEKLIGFDKHFEGYSNKSRAK